MEAVHGFFSNGSCICVLLPSVYWTLCTKIAIPLLPHAQWHWRCDVSQNRQAPQHPLCSKNSLFPSDCRSIKPLPFFLVLVKSIFLNCACLEWFGGFFSLLQIVGKWTGLKKAQLEPLNESLTQWETRKCFLRFEILGIGLLRLCVFLLLVGLIRSDGLKYWFQSCLVQNTAFNIIY